jgi:hypothetical protein
MQLIMAKNLFKPFLEYIPESSVLDQLTQERFFGGSNWDVVYFPSQTNSVRLKTYEEFSLFLESSKKLELLSSFYRINNEDIIRKFLIRYDYLIETLFEVRSQIDRIFSENLIEVCLEYHKDSEEDYEGLFVIVENNATTELSLNLLEQFDEEWWLDTDARMRRQLTVMVRQT